MFGLLLFSSCNENESESFITKEMKNYISNNVDGSYGFFERNMVKEHIDSFSWKSDIYRIQRQLYMYASQRRTILANNYVPLTKTTGWLFPNIFESNFEKPQGYAKKIKESYITEEEREICDYIYYSESVPKIRKMIKDLEEEDFMVTEYIMLAVIELLLEQLSIDNLFYIQMAKRILLKYLN